jgi:hypothetical protein
MTKCGLLESTPLSSSRGFFRDFMDDRSLIKMRTRITAYEAAVRKTGIFALERSHRQPEDPAKLAALNTGR